MTHQLTVLSGKTTWLTSKWHQDIIKKFDKCWVPDFKNTPNLSGDLGHPKHKLENIKYIGPLSRFNKHNLDIDQLYTHALHLYLNNEKLDILFIKDISTLANLKKIINRNERFSY